LIYPPADVLAKLPFQKDIGDDELEYSDRWTKVKRRLTEVTPACHG
jgi:spermidine/putrescine transport system substrate-binding protein